MGDPGRHAGAGAAQRHSGPWVCPECGASYTGAGACPADGHVVQRATDSLLGQMVGSYRLTRLIGAGGMGRVYQAVQPSIGARVAVKVLSSDVGQDRELVERFFAEARAVNLIRHEQIVNIVDLDFLPDGRPYIVMEFLEGRPLSAVMAARGPLPLGTLAQLMIEVLGALAAAHEHRVVHRDLKPDNIFVSPQGRAKVLDFGIAKLDRGAGMGGTTRAGAILGTPQYMSPEQALSRPVDARTDLYAAGVILYEGVSGRPPFAADSMFELLQKQIGEPPQLLRPLRPELPVAYEQVILRAMAKDPAHRFASAAEMSAALASATAGLGPEAWAPLGTAPAPPVTPAQSREARNLRTSIALAALALALAGTVALLARGRGGGADAGTRVTVTPDAATRVAREWGPPRLYTQLSSGGYIMTFVLPGRPLEILWRVAGEGDYRPTGDDPQTLDPGSGRPVAKIWFLLDPPRGPITLQVKYRTPDDVWHGPFDIKLDPAEAAVREAKEMLGMLPRWIELSDFQGTRLAYFTTLVMLRDALTVIEYGFDEEPSRRLRFTPSDRPSRDIADEDEVYVVVPRGTKQVSVRVSYRDGTRSEIRRYDTPPGEPEPVAKMPMNPDDLSWLVELARLLGDEGLTRPLAINYLGSDAGDDGSGRDGHIVSPRSPYLGRVVVYALPAAGIDVAIDLELEPGVRPSRQAMQLAFGALRSVARAPGDRPSGGKLAADVPGTRAVVRLLVELDPDDRSRVARVQVTAAPRPPGGS